MYLYEINNVSIEKKSEGKKILYVVLKKRYKTIEIAIRTAEYPIISSIKRTNLFFIFFKKGIYAHNVCLFKMNIEISTYTIIIKHIKGHETKCLPAASSL